MARTHRYYYEHQCLRSPKTTGMIRAREALLGLEDDLLEVNASLSKANRIHGKYIVTAYDDIPVSALSETKQLWKHNRKPKYYK